jgi:hypothetical protein
VQSIRIRSEFWGQFFLFKRELEEWSRSRPFSVLNNRISTCFERTWTTSTCQSYYGIKSNTSYKVNGRTTTNPYCRCVPISITLVIVDGLDECHDQATQQFILRLLCETITVHKLPLRFLIGSRPESHIREIFDQESLYAVTRRVVLDETFKPGRDIQVFLQDGFAKMSAKNPILSHIKQPWPEKGIIDLLVQRSSGQSIYAATVLKFVGADFCSPTKQLALVLKPDPTAFSDLDQLYICRR